MDQTAIRKRRWYRLLTATSVWLPVIAGGLTMLVFGGTAGNVIGLSCLGLGTASAIWKLTGGSQQLTRQAVEDLQEQDNREHFGYLRQLQRQLREDKDQRTGQNLRDLRDLYKRMLRAGILTSGSDSQIVLEVKEQAKQLYQSCLKSLERSCKLWQAAQDMTTTEKRDQLLASREHVVVEVTSSIEHLGKTLDHLQTVQLEKEMPADDLSELRRELEQGLEVAREVERRMDQLESDLRVGEGA